MAKKKSKSKTKKTVKTKDAAPAKHKKGSKKKAGGKKKKSAKPKGKPEPVVLTHDQIARRAFELWMDRGQPQGQDDILWHEAEAQLLKS